jgi:hypothetical protein
MNRNNAQSKNQNFGANQPIINGNYSQNHGMFNLPRNLNSNFNQYGQMHPQYSMHKPSINSYQHMHSHVPQYISMDTHELLVKQYKLTLTMIKAQNNSLI